VSLHGPVLLEFVVHWAAENSREHLRLALVGAVVNEDAGAPIGLSRPKIAFPPSHPDEAQIIEIDIAVMAMAYVPEQDRPQKPLSGACAKVQGHATAQLQLSNQSPVMCQLGFSVMRTSIRHERRYDTGQA
jgi:hypothetical protein